MPDQRRQCLPTAQGDGFRWRWGGFARLGWLAAMLSFVGTAVPLAAQAPTRLLQPSDQLVWSVGPNKDFKAGLSLLGKVAPDGTLNLGRYGTLRVAGLTLDQANAAIARRTGLAASPVPGRAPAPTTAPSFVVSPHNVLAWTVTWKESQPPRTFAGKGEVQPDGTLSLGGYGVVRVAGLSAERAQAVIEHQVVASLSAAASKPAVLPASWLLAQAPVDLQPRTPSAAAFQPLPTGPAHPKGLFNASTPESPKPSDARTTRAVPPPASGPAPAKPTDAPVPLPEPTPVEPASSPPPVPDVAAHLDLCAPGHPAPRECRLTTLPPYIIAPPDILLVESTQQLRDQPIRGQHLVRPDGTIGLGIYGSIPVAGLTIEQARAAIAQVLAQRIKDIDINNLSVDVLAYNSKTYYVITDGGGYGEQVFRLPVTGNETILDAISLVNGLPPVASKCHIWLARPCCAGNRSHVVLPVDWVGITQSGNPDTNYQVFPGDRIYVKADPWITFDAGVAKVLAPFERMLGITLLGSEVVNSIRNRPNGTGSGF
jgi:polysaccharide export outer membrane protein